MGSLDFSTARKSPQSTENEFAEKLKTSWAVIVLLASGIFALVTAILIAWPALAFLASRFFQ